MTAKQRNRKDVQKTSLELMKHHFRPIPWCCDFCGSAFLTSRWESGNLFHSLSGTVFNPSRPIYLCQDCYNALEEQE